MAKVLDLNTSSGEFGAHAIYCKGCDTFHAFDNRWEFNGNFEKPTFSPSMLVYPANKPEKRCHSFVRDGKIQYLDDCFHQYKGQTLELEDID
jgi:hypothetical protein